MRTSQTRLPDRFHDECGVFAVWNAKHASALVAKGLAALQHRGPEGAGLVVVTNRKSEELEKAGAREAGARTKTLERTAALGSVKTAIDPSWIKRTRSATSALGHVRYSTSPDRSARGLQPFVHDGSRDPERLSIALAHNGNLTRDLRPTLHTHSNGALQDAASDSQQILQLLSLRSQDAPMAVAMGSLLTELEGAYALAVVDSSGELYALRDPRGIRPLSIGVLPRALRADPSRHALVIASETVALDTCSAELVGSAPRGAVVVASALAEDPARALRRLTAEKQVDVPERFCLFETIYFASATSLFRASEGEQGDAQVGRRRQALGRALAEAAPALDAIVVPVPRTGIDAARGFADASDLELVEALSTESTTRAFLAAPGERVSESRKKLQIDQGSISGKKLVLVDDSLVRGHTLRELITRLRTAGAVSIHVRIASPPVHFPCFFGIDTPTQEELLAPRFGASDDGADARKKLESAVAAAVGADSLAYLDLSTTRAIAAGRGLCDACFSGDFPLPVEHLFKRHP